MAPAATAEVQEHPRRGDGTPLPDHVRAMNEATRARLAAAPPDEDDEGRPRRRHRCARCEGW